MTYSTFFRVVALLAGLALPVSAVPLVVSNTPSFTGSPVQIWGALGSETYGQRFVVPASVVSFDSVTFLIQNNPGSPIAFDAYLANWNNATNRATGAPLAQVTGQVAPGTNSGPNGFDAVTVNFGSVPVSAGQDLVVYFTTIGQAGSPVAGSWGFVSAGSAGVSDFFVFSNSGTIAGLTDGSAPWTVFGFGSAAFSASFTAVVAGAPEIGRESAVVGLAVAGLFLLVCRRREVVR